MDRPPRGSLKLDIASAYLLTGVRLAAWLLVSAVVYRYGRKEALAAVALVRSTLGLINYAGFGLGPAIIHFLSCTHAASEPVTATTLAPNTTGQLEYESRPPLSAPTVITPAEQLFFGAIIVSLCSAVVGTLILFPSARYLGRLAPYGLGDTRDVAMAFGFGVLARLISDAVGATLQATGRIVTDNLLQAAAEASWAVMVYLAADKFTAVGSSYALSGVLLIVARVVVVSVRTPFGTLRCAAASFRAVWLLLSFGAMVTLAQAADFLYAPTDNLLIANLLNPELVSVYVPAIQVDAALLLSVTAMAAVLLPRAAIEHGKGNIETVRRYYLRGTLASLALLTTGALAAYLLAPAAFRLWLHDPMPATQAILPFVLVHTVVGGSSAVGRSILLAVGKVKPFTAAVLCAGVANVLLSYAFVRYAHLGLRGIVLGTIVAVTARCALWQPWYVLRTLRRGDVRAEDGVELAPAGPEVA